jgi:hypothetical protein
MPTSGWSVRTWVSGWTCSRALAKAVTSSVDSVQVKTVSSSRNGVANATSHSRHKGIERTRRGAPSTRSTAADCSWIARAPGTAWLATVVSPTAD